MEILSPDDFFKRVSPPETWKPFNCGGVVNEDTTREELLARGFSPDAADEVLAYRARLAAQQGGTET